MMLRIKSKKERWVLIVFTVVALLPLTGFAKTKPIMTTDLLQHLRKGEPWDRSVFTATKMVMFQQDANTSEPPVADATSIAKITLSYFTSNNCTATNGTSVPTYTTPDGAFTISTLSPFTPIPFGMVAASVWNLGNSINVFPHVADITAITSIAVTFKSTTDNTPQASFTGISFACVPVTCNSGECYSGSATQSFELKTTAAVGDPADGGIIGCQNTGISPNLFNLVVPASNNNSGSTIVWATTPGGSNTALGSTAQSATNGATNTNVIVNCLTNNTCPVLVTPPPQTAATNYAAGVCSSYTAAGGFTSGWFLPSGSRTAPGNQINCLCQNRVAIQGFGTATYWSSQESSSGNATRMNFSACGAGTASKVTPLSVRCSRAF